MVKQSVNKKTGKSKKSIFEASNDENIDNTDTYNNDKTKDTEDQENIEDEETIDDEEEVDSEIEDEDDLNDNVEVEDEDIELTANNEFENDKKCIYNYAENSDSENEEDEPEELFDDDEQQESNIVDKEKRITKPILYKYERVRLIGTRSKQLAMGAKPLIKNADDLTSEEIATLELKHNKIQMIIERPLPNGKKELWKTSELKH